MSFVGTGASFWTGYNNIPSSQAKPISMFGWYKRPTSNTGQRGGLIGLGTSYYQPSASLNIRPDISNVSLVLDDVSPTTGITVGGDAVISTGPTWYPFGAVVRNLSNRTVYNGDGSTSTDTTAQTACLYDQLVIAGTTRSGTVASPLMLGHQIAECAIWYGELGVGEMSSLISGENPLNLQRPDLAYYFPLVDSVDNYGGAEIYLSTYGGLPNQWGDHPNVSQVQPPRRYYYVGIVYSFGNLTQTQGAMTIASNASLVVNGQFAQTLNAMTLAAAGSESVLGSLVATQGAMILGSAGIGPVLGAMNSTLGSMTINGHAGTGNSAYLRLALDSNTFVGSGSVQGTKATLGITLPPNTFTGRAVNPVGGTLTQALGAATFSGVLKAPVNGTLSENLIPWQIAATAKVLDVEGGVSQFLSPAILSGASSILVGGALRQQMVPVAVHAVGTVIVDGSLVATTGMYAENLRADAAQPTGVLHESMGAMALTGIAADPVDGRLSAPLGSMTGNLAGLVTGYVGNLNQTLGANTLAATGGPVATGNLVKTMNSMISATAQAGPVVPNPSYTYHASPPAPNWWPSKLVGTTRAYGLDISAYLTKGESVTAIAASVAPGGEMQPVAIYYADSVITLLVTGGLPTRVYTVKFVVTTTTPDIFEILVHQDIPKELNWNRDQVPVNPDFGTNIQWSGEPPPAGFVAPYYFFA